MDNEEQKPQTVPAKPKPKEETKPITFPLPATA